MCNSDFLLISHIDVIPRLFSLLWVSKDVIFPIVLRSLLYLSSDAHSIRNFLEVSFVSFTPDEFFGSYLSLESQTFSLSTRMSLRLRTVWNYRPSCREKIKTQHPVSHFEIARNTGDSRLWSCLAKGNREERGEREGGKNERINVRMQGIFRRCKCGFWTKV